MPTQPEFRKDTARHSPQADAATTIQTQAPRAVPAPKPAVERKADPSVSLSPAFRRQIPKFLLDYEPLPMEVFDENPLLNVKSAAVLLGISPDLMKKWRQRGWGPNFIQYGKDGPVRYEFGTLMEFRIHHKVQTRSKRRQESIPLSSILARLGFLKNGSGLGRSSWYSASCPTLRIELARVSESLCGSARAICTGTGYQSLAAARKAS